MRIACIQMDMQLGKVDENFAHAEALIRNTAAQDKPDTIVLPELWDTGFFPQELAPCTDEDGARTKAVFSNLARELNVNIVAGSVVTKKKGGFFNTAYVFDLLGQVTAEYDKIHLFSPMGEDDAFQSGHDICRFTLGGILCGLIICYDLRFPELVRTLALQGIELLFVVSQWPESRAVHLEVLSRARAIENQVFVALCNSCGAAGSTKYAGRSAIIDPWGADLVRADGSEEIITADLNFSVTQEIRSSTNVFRDRKPQCYRVTD